MIVGFKFQVSSFKSPALKLLLIKVTEFAASGLFDEHET